MNQARVERETALVSVTVKLDGVNSGILRTESLSNVLRIAVTEAWFSAVLVAFSFSVENRQFLY
jgi:hypothetical protein